MRGRQKKTLGPAERLTVDPTSPWWGEHRSRYRFVQSLIGQRRVLDIACGSGFGCEMLVEGGASYVVGADNALEAMRSAQARAYGRRLRFVQADGTALPFRDAAFDMVVSLETLEHIEACEAFLGEVRRVTKKDGLLVLSTPNALITRRYPRNPFHCREFTPVELGSLLRRFYGHVELRGQVLGEHYRIAPFIPGRERVKSVCEYGRLAAWRAMNRLPFRVKNFLAVAVTGRQFYPTETDYHFGEQVESAPVLIASCRT